MDPNSEKNPGANQPFREPLIESPVGANSYGYLEQPENDPEKVIRSEPLIGFARKLETYSEVLAHPDEEMEGGLLAKALEGVKKANEMLAELKYGYAIDMPLLGFVIGKNKEGKSVVYTVAEKIHGENLREKQISEEEKATVEEKLQKIYLSLISYFQKKYRTGEPFLADIARNRQFMVGHTAKDPAEKIYLVDVEAYPETGHTLLLGEIRMLLKEAAELKQKLGLDLDDFDERVAKFISDLPFEERQEILREALPRR